MTRERLLNSRRLHDLLDASGLDAVIISSPTNLFYVSGTMIITHLPIRDRLELALVAPGEEPVLVLCHNESGLVREDSWVREFRTYPEFHKKPMELMGELVREKGLERGRLGVEKRYTRAQYFRELARALPGATFVACDDLLDRARAVKTEGEIARLGSAVAAVEKAVERSLSSAKRGDSERALSELLAAEIANLGAEGSFQVVAAAARTANVFNKPGLDAIAPGEPVRVQLVGIFDGYAAVVSRMATVGEPLARQLDAYDRAAEIQQMLVQRCRPGIAASELFAYGETLGKKAGLELSRPYVGYSFGLGEQERPILGPAEDWILEPDMVLAIGPILGANGTHYQLEDMVRVTADGAERLSGGRLPAPLAVIYG